MESRWRWTQFIVLIMFLFTFGLYQNCGDFNTSQFEIQKGLSTVESGPSSLTSESGVDASRSKLPVLKSLGLIYGPNATQAAIDNTAHIGSWYYTYSPHPNRADSAGTNETVTSANKYGKEFVPMIHSRVFKYGPGDSSCVLIDDLVQNSGQRVCTIGEMTQALKNIKSLFVGQAIPKKLIFLNEPWLAGDQASPVLNRSFIMTPWQAARAFSKVEKSATAAGLSLVSPTVASEGVALDWFTHFLKRCFDLKDEPDFACELEKIEVFAYHDYKCASDFFSNLLGESELKARIIRKMRNSEGRFYGGYDWSAFVSTRKIWLTETTCNHDPDFAQAQRNGQYIRSQAESCRRATGQKKGYGSLPVLKDLPASKLERFAWWTTYANPRTDTDIAQVNPSSQNRINSARLIDDNNELTSMGRAINALSVGNDLSQVQCD